MIMRLWHGRTADRYERLLKEQIFLGIAAKAGPGYRKIELLRRPLQGAEVEFLTIMRFDSWRAVKALAREDYEPAYVAPAARAILARFDDRAQTTR